MSTVKKLAVRKNLTANGHFDQDLVIWSDSHTTKYAYKIPAVYIGFEILRDFYGFSRSTKAKGISRALSRVMICLTDMCLDIFTKCGIFNYDCSNMVQGQFHEI